MTDKGDRRSLLQKENLRAGGLKRHPLYKQKIMLDSNIFIKVVLGGQSFESLVLNTKVIVFDTKDSHLIFLTMISQSSTCGFHINTTKKRESVNVNTLQRIKKGKRIVIFSTTVLPS